MRGNYIPKELRSHYGRQAGLISGMVRQQRRLDKYRDLVSKEGIDFVLKLCIKTEWIRGYDARKKFELRREKALQKRSF